MSKNMTREQEKAMFASQSKGKSYKKDYNEPEKDNETIYYVKMSNGYVGKFTSKTMEGAENQAYRSAKRQFPDDEDIYIAEIRANEEFD